MGYLRLLKDKQEAFFRTGETLSWNFRKKQLQKIKSLIYSYQEELIFALKKDLDKSEFESITSELLCIVEEIQLFCKNLPKWEKPKKAKKTLSTIDGRGYTIRKPFGTSLIIAPWNYPVQLVFMPLIGAIGGGNCAIIKTSEFAPTVSRIVAKIINTHFDEKYLKVVEGGKEKTQELLSLGFDKIFYTGSTHVGKIVMERASHFLSDVTLELGGKSPVIIDFLSKKDLLKSLKRIIWGKFINSGQTCIAPDYILLDKRMEANFLLILPQIMEQFNKEKPMHKIINKMHYNRLKQYLEDGEILFGGKFDDRTHSIELTVLKISNLDTPLMVDEIFGPILPVIIYHEKKDVEHLINRICSSPLAMYVFSQNKEFINYFLNKISFGSSSINDTVSQILVQDLPFGGVKESGMGSYHGIYSYHCFTKMSSIFKKGFGFDLPFRYPPYDKNINIVKSIFEFYKNQ